jgi:hypothetical protein
MILVLVAAAAALAMKDFFRGGDRLQQNRTVVWLRLERQK